MRTIASVCLFSALVFACGGKSNADDGDGDGSVRPDACVGIECNIVDCGAMSLPPTSITGTVFAPNGTLPLNGVNVYVPRDPLPPFVEGVTCDRCATTLPGSPVRQTVSAADGTFRLDNVPAGADVPLVITTGKWRRVVTIPNVSQCMDNSLGAADTRLPKNKSEGDIPKIALTTGGADSLECLLRKLGIDDAEITTDAGAGRVHLYVGGNTANATRGVSSSAAGNFADSQTMWNDAAKLKTYDIVFLSCEGDQNPDLKTQAAMNNMKDYADIGGRVFASHWHNVWIGGEFQSGGPDSPAVWNTIATWNPAQANPSGPILIDEVSNPKGPLFADWMLNVGGSTVRDEIPMQSGTERATSVTVDATRAEKWVNARPANGSTPQMFQFTTPNEVAPDQRCGKVVFTDMHVTGTSNVGNQYPASCPGGATNLTLTAQEKALAFMFFDIASCVGGIF